MTYEVTTNKTTRPQRLLAELARDAPLAVEIAERALGIPAEGSRLAPLGACTEKFRQLGQQTVECEPTIWDISFSVDCCSPHSNKQQSTLKKMTRIVGSCSNLYV